MKTYKFRPQQWSTRTSKHRRYIQSFNRDYNNVNWHVRHWYDNFLSRCGSQLHYLADHAPYPLRKKWKPVFQKFIQHHRKF